MAKLKVFSPLTRKVIGMSLFLGTSKEIKSNHSPP